MILSCFVFFCSFFEKQGLQVVKLTLTFKYFENCLDLDLCPEFLKLKTGGLVAASLEDRKIHLLSSGQGNLGN